MIGGKTGQEKWEFRNAIRYIPGTQGKTNPDCQGAMIVPVVSPWRWIHYQGLELL